METAKILKISALGSDEFILNSSAKVLASAFEYAGKFVLIFILVA
jgi:hypothetical protein